MASDGRLSVRGCHSGNGTSISRSSPRPASAVRSVNRRPGALSGMLPTSLNSVPPAAVR